MRKIAVHWFLNVHTKCYKIYLYTVTVSAHVHLHVKATLNGDKGVETSLIW